MKLIEWWFMVMLVIVLSVCLFSCTRQLHEARSDVADAAERRETICRFVIVWSDVQPELKTVRQLCEAGDDLKVIAAAYAGCSPQ